MNKFKAYIVAHKAVSVVGGVVIIGAAYGVWSHTHSSAAVPTYSVAAAAKGTLITSVSGSGQVAAENQVDVTSTVSGTVTGVYVQDSQAVKQGDVLASIDDADAVRAVNDAQLSVENAQVALDKAVKDDADQAATSTSSDLAKAYQAGYNAIVATAIDMPAMFSGLNDIFYTASHSPYFSDINITTQVDAAAATYKLQAGSTFDDAKAEYDANFLRFKNISANSSPDEIVSLLNETNVILKKLLSALSETYSTIDYIQDKLSKIPPELTTDKSTLSADVSKVNSDTSSVTDALTAIDDAQTSGTTADLNMKSAQLAVSQAEATLSDDQTALADHRVKAPFDGLIAKVSAKVNDIASNGTAIATEVTTQEMVNIALNEIDAAKVAAGDKATLTFDAIDGLSLAGHVSNVDLVGTVSQGVVTYTAEVAFDDIDPRVKPGMTVNAEIITSAKQDVLMVPSSAVKTQGGTQYVQVLPANYTSATVPTNVPVTVGDSNDTSVEIASGISEGDLVVTKTTTATAAKTTTPSLLSGLTGGRAGGAGGGAVRIGAGGAAAGAARGN